MRKRRPILQTKNTDSKYQRKLSLSGAASVNGPLRVQIFFDQVIRPPHLISAKEMKINSTISHQNNLDLNLNVVLDLGLLLVMILKQMICVNLENLLFIWNPDCG